MKFYPGQLSEKIGFESIRSEAIRLTSSPMGRERLERLKPATGPERVKELLKLTDEMMDLQLNDAAFPLEHPHDIRESISHARPEGSRLSPEALLEIFQFAVTARRVKQFIEDRKERYEALSEISVQLIPLKELEKAIRKVVTEHGEIRNDASGKLKSIRSRLGNRRKDLRNTINKVMGRATKKGFASDEGPTIRNGRMVIPILAEHKRKIQGFIHDVSSSGQTVYLEPVEALNINNEIRQLELEEEREIERILIGLTKQVRRNGEYLSQNCETLGKFDAIRAKANLSIKLDGFTPVISKDRYIRLKEALNPILLLKNLQLDESDRDPVIPLNLELEQDEKCLMITGPNAGGKSVAIKTVGLCAVMMQSGLAIPAKDTSELPIFDKLFVDMGDDQSIENDLSTFSSRLEWMRNAVEESDEKSLVLIDEAGAGTDPDEGGALYQALIEHLMDQESISLVTTHHGALKVFAHEHPNAVNGSMEFDQDTLSPTYRFKKGIPGSSYAFEIAERMNLDPGLLSSAREITGKSKQDLESLINELEIKTQEAEKLREKYRRLKDRMESERHKYEDKRQALEKEKDNIRQKALKQAEEIMQSANRRIEEAVEKIAVQGSKDDEVIKEARKEVDDTKEKISGELDELESKKKEERRKKLSKEPPEIGDNVRLMDANTTGELVEVSGNKAVVQAGALRLKTDYDNLVRVESDGESKKRGSRVTVNLSGVERKPVKPSLNIRGLRGPDAVKEVQDYIDRAIAAGMNTVDIVHGKGEGILKKLVHEHLEQRSDVKNYTLADPHEGGAGVTVVEL